MQLLFLGKNEKTTEHIRRSHSIGVACEHAVPSGTTRGVATSPAGQAGAGTALKKHAQKQVWDLSPGAVLTCDDRHVLALDICVARWLAAGAVQWPQPVSCWDPGPCSDQALSPPELNATRVSCFPVVFSSSQSIRVLSRSRPRRVFSRSQPRRLRSVHAGGEDSPCLLPAAFLSALGSLLPAWPSQPRRLKQLGQ